MKKIRHLSKWQKSLVIRHGDRYFNDQNLYEVFSDNYYSQRVPMIDFNYVIRLESPIIYYKNELPIIMN